MIWVQKLLRFNRTYILLLLFASGMQMSAAQETFSKRYEFNEKKSVFNGVVPSDTGYFVTGIIGTETANTGAFFGFFDLEGNLVWSKVIADSIYSYRPWAQLFYDSTNQTFVTGGGIINHPDVDVLLLRYDVHGAVVDSATFRSPKGNGISYGSTATRDGGYAFSFQDWTAWTSGDYSVLKVDRDFNQEWFTWHDAGQWELPLDVDQNADGDLVVTGHSNNQHQVDKNFIWQHFVAILDEKTGAQKDFYISPKDRLLGGGAVLPIKGGYLLGVNLGVEVELQPDWGQVLSQPMIVRMDTVFNTLWETPFITNDPYVNIRIEDIIKVEDENYVAVAMSVDTGVINKLIALHFKFSSSGEKIWMRMHDIIMTQPTAFQHPKQVAQTLDGGYIIAAQSYTYSPPENVQSGWLIKTDSMGCVVPGCHLVATEELPEDMPDVRLHPNPAHDFLHVFARHEEDLQLRIYDLQGQLMGQFETRAGEGTWSVEVAHFAPGMYVLQITDPKAGQFSMKFLKE